MFDYLIAYNSARTFGKEGDEEEYREEKLE